MVTRRPGRAAVAGLVVFPALILSLASCTGSSGQQHFPAGSPAAAPSSPAPGSAAASLCTRAEIRTAISGFFGAWNHRDAAALGRLFSAGGELDMATKHQDTLGGPPNTWASAGGGPGAPGQIAAFAERQWRLGEKLSYHGIEIIRGGSGNAGGGDAIVVARFADGTAQPMEEAKFGYDCVSRAFSHVVIVSAKAAAPA
jgi:hypothetical protein